MGAHDLVWAAVVTGIFSMVAIVLSNRHQRNLKSLALKIDVTNDRLDTGNHVKIGRAVLRLEQNQGVILQNQSLQTMTLAQHGSKLIELTEHQGAQSAKLDRVEARMAEQQAANGHLQGD